jgi:ubiquinone/menaquinone biosynthesis C-methylase UbiE
MTRPTPLPPQALPPTWDLMADDYTAEVVPLFERYAEDALAAARVERGQRIVDVAAGPGTLALPAARRGARVDALDFSEQMVTRLRARASAAGLAIDARVGDGQALPYADDTFDAGFSIFGLFMFPDRDRGFRELGRVVKPGGAIAVTSWPPRDRVPALRALASVLAARTPNLPFANLEPPLGTPESFRAEMEAAGLHVVDVRRIGYPREFATGDALWEWLARTMVPLVLLARDLGDGWPPVAAELRAAVLAAVGAGPATIEMPALLGLATA